MDFIEEEEKRVNDKLKTEILGENQDLNSEKDIFHSRIREQAIILSNEINEYCHRFRDHLKNKQTFGYNDLLAKLYYDIAYANYKYYSADLVKDNLLSVKNYLEKSNEQFSDEGKICDKINIVKEARYLLDSVCDLYLRTNIDSNNRPVIPGNAVILVKKENSRDYFGYFVENGSWIEQNTDLKYIRLKKLDLDDILFHDKSGLVRKSERNAKKIEDIIRNAQFKRGRASINMKYYALKRKAKELEKTLEEKVSYALNLEDEEEMIPKADDSNRLARFFNRARTTVVTALNKIGYDGLGINNLPLIVCQILSELVECYLEIGLIDQVEYYIEILSEIVIINFQDKLDEYHLRKELIVQLREIMECETALLSSKEDDVQSFVVQKPENTSDYNTEIEKWKKNHCTSDNQSVLFVYNFEKTENQWEGWFWIPNRCPKIFQIEINDKSILHIFLKHIYYNKTINLFSSELLDMLGEENIVGNLEQNSDFIKYFFLDGEFNLKSKTTKIIQICHSLRNAYEYLGNYPLENRYQQILSYFFKQRDKFREQFSSSYDIHLESSNPKQNQFPVSLFPVYSRSAIKKLNDSITEKEFFSNILPYIDQIDSFKRSFTIVHHIDWLLCSSRSNLEKSFQIWHVENQKFQKENFYERKYLLLLVECDFYFLSHFNEKNLPKINGNAIVLTRISQNSDHYQTYFVKDSRWIKDENLGGFKDLLLKISLKNTRIDKTTGLIDKDKFHDQNSKNQLEKIAVEMHLNRWYFYGEMNDGRIFQGFLDQKIQLKDLSIYLKDISSEDLKKVKNRKLRSKENRILNELWIRLGKDFHQSSSIDYFIKPIKSENEIKIYDLHQSDHGKDLKVQMKSDPRKNFVCLVKLSNQRYITLFVEKERFNQKNHRVRDIYVINSTSEKARLKKLLFLTGVSDRCIYKLDFIQCPKQKLMSEDSFLHAYFNASACQWAFENNHWQFLKRFFSRQEFSSKENIEKIKEWFVQSTGSISFLSHVENQILSTENIPLIERFQTNFLEIIRLHLNSLKTNEIHQSIENLTKTISNSNTYTQILDTLEKISSKENFIEVKECLNAIEKARDDADERTREPFDLNAIIDLMFSTLKEYSSSLLPSQEKLSQHLEIFEDRFHHAILSTMTSNENKTYPNYAHRLKMFFDLSLPNSINEFQSSDYFKFLEFIDKFLQTEKNFSERKILISSCQNMRKIFEEMKNNCISTDEITKKSLSVIFKFIQLFENIEHFFKEFDQIFQNLLHYSYELLDLSEINLRLKNDIYNLISYQKQNFDDIKKCIDGLFKNINRNSAIKIDFNIEISKKKIGEIFHSLNNLIENKDERAVHYIGSYLRQLMINTVEKFMNSLAMFRHNSLISMETFEKVVHQHLINSIRDSIRNQNKNQLVNQAMDYLQSTNLVRLKYDERIDTYKNIIQIFSRENNDIPVEVIISVRNQLENLSHSHFIYLEKKTNDLINMIIRFANIGEVLPDFSQLFEKCLSEKYDHRSEKDVFSTDGQMKKEILDRLTSNQTWNDIKQIVHGFENDALNKILDKCEQFTKDKDERGSAEISECLRKSIVDTIENYTASLLAFRHGALIAFNNFEKNFYQLLSTYEAIRNQPLRNSLQRTLNELIALPDKLEENYYHRALSVYKRFVDNLDEDQYRKCAEMIQKILNEGNHSLRPHFAGKINNLKNILNSFIYWYQIEHLKKHEYEIIQVQTHSAILSEIIGVIKNTYPDCFCSNNEIRIISSNKLFIDIDLVDSKYSGVNIVLVSPHQELVKDKAILKIITNGGDAKDNWKDNPAKNAQGTDHKGRGNKGEDGSDGKPGQSAGHVYVVANELPKIEVSACGGKGGQGQSGGNGASGLDGTDGKDAEKEALLKKSCEGDHLYSEWAIRYRRIGTDGTPAGWGGDAGSGGYRGDGGNPGLIKLVSLNDISQQLSYENLVGEPGNGEGRPGQPGEAGRHGKDGLDYVAIGKWGFIKREVSLKGGRLYSNERYDHDDEDRLFENYSMLPMEDDAGKPRFKSKYDDPNAQKGATATQKHKDREVVKKIHAINHQNVFEETSQFFNQFNNPQNISSYQHWLAPNLNNFLDKMALFEGLPPSEIHALPNTEHDAKQILILKEQFAQVIFAENQRIQNERINTDQMSIGMTLLGQQIRSQHDDFLQQYQTVYRQLLDDIQRVDINQLTTGAEIRHVEIANLRNTINRIINEQRFNQRLAALKRRTEVLVDVPKENFSKSIFDQQNVRIIKENISEEKWRNFSAENNIIDAQIIKEFNQNPNEESLLKIGCHFLLKLEEIHSNTEINHLNLNEAISNFTSTYLYNLQQGDYNFLGLKYIDDQKRIFHQILPQLRSFENTSTLDLLIDFSKGIQREYLRHYWLLWTRKTFECQKREEFNLLEMLRVADNDQIEQLDIKLRSSSFLREFPSYDFDEKLYGNNRSELIQSIEKFNEETNETNLVEIFRIFSNSLIFDRNLLSNLDQLDLINDFLFNFQHNLSLIDIENQNLDVLIEQLIKIEKILIQNPRSYFHDIIFHFSIVIEKIKQNHSTNPQDNVNFDQICQSKDLYQLLNYQTSKSYKKKNFTIEQEIDAFNTLYDLTLIEGIFHNLSQSRELENLLKNSKVIEFIRWTTDHFQTLKYETLDQPMSLKPPQNRRFTAVNCPVNWALNRSGSDS